jgi:hypothetical protein
MVILGVYVFVSLTLPDFSGIKDGLKLDLTRFDTLAAKLFALGLVQNPAALYKYSEVEEAARETDNAIREMELAIGLLEMHNAN